MIVFFCLSVIREPSPHQLHLDAQDVDIMYVRSSAIESMLVGLNIHNLNTNDLLSARECITNVADH